MRTRPLLAERRLLERERLLQAARHQLVVLQAAINRPRAVPTRAE